MNDFFNEKDELVCGRCWQVVDTTDFTCECSLVVDGDAKEIRDIRTGHTVPFEKEEKQHKSAV